MRKTRQSCTSRSLVALACGGLAALGAGCGIGAGPADEAGNEEVTIQVRFHGETGDVQQIFGFQSLVAPIEFTDVDRILVDVSYAATGQPFAVNFALNKIADDQWEGTLPFLPRDEQLRFFAEALDADDTVIFSGETVTTLIIDNQEVEIPLAPAQDQETFDLPRMVRMVYPSDIVAGQEVQVIFTIEGNAGETIDYAITSADESAPFSPASGRVTLTNTVADFVALYTAPDVDTETDFDHEVVITSADSLSSVAVASNFTTHVIPRAEGIPGGPAKPSVLFNPVVLNVVADGTAIPDTVELLADVSDDGDPTTLSYQWSFTPNDGTPAASFASSGQGNPGLLQSYTGDVQGTVTLDVTDANGGTTTLFYEVIPEQFTHLVDHAAANGIKKIVTGRAHTCVLTGEGNVRCWGDSQFGQLGYGNAQDIGDTEDRLPYTAGDVPLPEPAIQLVAGDNHTCALLESGLMYCWGRNDFGQLGYNTTDHLGDGEPVTSFGYVTLGDLAVKIAAGGNHTCAILEGGALRCWGHNQYGQLGHGHTNNLGDDENVYAAGNVTLEDGVAVEDVALGRFHTCALLTGGNMRCWGRNDDGELGYGHSNNIGDNETLEALPDVSLPGPVRKLAAGISHTCALMQNGAMRCWGFGVDGRTGYGFRSGSNPNYGDQSSEIPLNLPDIDTGAEVTDMTAGDRHTCALLSSGALKCWGKGENGRLGYNNQNNQGTPRDDGVDLVGVSAYQLSAGYQHTCALRSNGTARCWGAGGSGRLGSGATGDIYTPAASPDIQVFAP